MSRRLDIIRRHVKAHEMLSNFCLSSSFSLLPFVANLIQILHRLCLHIIQKLVCVYIFQRVFNRADSSLQLFFFGSVKKCMESRYYMLGLVFIKIPLAHTKSESASQLENQRDFFVVVGVSLTYFPKLENIGGFNRSAHHYH